MKLYFACDSFLIVTIPGPQWLPQSAEAVQNRLKNNNYTEGKCMPSRNIDF